jgi:hypothetical protein
MSLYEKFYLWLLRGVRAKFELGEANFWDHVRHWLVIKLPLPR